MTRLKYDWVKNTPFEALFNCWGKNGVSQTVGEHLVGSNSCSAVVIAVVISVMSKVHVFIPQNPQLNFAGWFMHDWIKKAQGSTYLICFTLLKKGRERHNVHDKAGKVIMHIDEINNKHKNTFYIIILSVLSRLFVEKDGDETMYKHRMQRFSHQK